MIKRIEQLGAEMRDGGGRQPTSPDENAWLVIDPTPGGGVAVWVGGIADAIPMPASEETTVRLLRGIQRSVETSGWTLVCVIAWANEDDDTSGSGRMARILTTLGLNAVPTRPQEWLAMPGVGGAASFSRAHARRNKFEREAQRRFPELEVTAQTAKALLILEWARIACSKPRRFSKGA
jgi:hypothetical protein